MCARVVAEVPPLRGRWRQYVPVRFGSLEAPQRDTTVFRYGSFVQGRSIAASGGGECEEKRAVENARVVSRLEQTSSSYMQCWLGKVKGALKRDRSEALLQTPKCFWTRVPGQGSELMHGRCKSI